MVHYILQRCMIGCGWHAVHLDPSFAFQTFESPDPSFGAVTDELSYPRISPCTQSCRDGPSFDTSLGPSSSCPTPVDRSWTVGNPPSILGDPDHVWSRFVRDRRGGWTRRSTPTSTAIRHVPNQRGRISNPKATTGGRTEAKQCAERKRAASKKNEHVGETKKDMKVAIRAGGPKAAPRAQSVRKRTLARVPLVVKNGFQRSPTKRKQDIGGPPTNPPPVRRVRTLAASENRKEIEPGKPGCSWNLDRWTNETRANVHQRCKSKH